MALVLGPSVNQREDLGIRMVTFLPFCNYKALSLKKLA